MTIIKAVGAARIAWGFYDWREQAACRNAPSVDLLFFPIGMSRKSGRQVEQALSMCRDCPVRSECLDFALASNQEHGVWGGKTEDERKTLRTERAQAEAQAS